MRSQSVGQLEEGSVHTAQGTERVATVDAVVAGARDDVAAKEWQEGRDNDVDGRSVGMPYLETEQD